MFEDFHLPCFFSCPKASDRYLIATSFLQQIALFGHKGLYRELPPMLQRATHDEFIFVHIPTDCCNAADSKYNDAFHLVIQVLPSKFQDWKMLHAKFKFKSYRLPPILHPRRPGFTSAMLATSYLGKILNRKLSILRNWSSHIRVYLITKTTSAIHTWKVKEWFYFNKKYLSQLSWYNQAIQSLKSWVAFVFGDYVLSIGSFISCKCFF